MTDTRNRLIWSDRLPQPQDSARRGHETRARSCGFADLEWVRGMRLGVAGWWLVGRWRLGLGAA